MSNSKVSPTIAIGVIVFALGCVGCVTALVAFGKDVGDLTNFIFLISTNLIVGVVISAKQEQTSQKVEEVSRAVNGQLDRKLEGIKQHVTTTVNDRAARHDDTTEGDPDGNV